MKRGRPPKFELKLSGLERQTLEQIGRSRSEPAGLVRRARGILWSSEGQSNDAIAARLNVSAATVCYWRKRFSADGLAGLYDRPKAGRARTHDDERVAGLLLHPLDAPLDLAVRMPADPAGYARRLYSALHELDDVGCDLILADAVPDASEWAGVRDRLARAAEGD